MTVPVCITGSQSVARLGPSLMPQGCSPIFFGKLHFDHCVDALSISIYSPDKNANIEFTLEVFKTEPKTKTLSLYTTK